MPESFYPEIVAGPPKPSAIIQPRAFSLPPGTGRYVVAGGGALLVPMETGDALTLTNDEGGQLCEIVAADEKGRIDPAMLGGSATSNGDGLKALLMSGDASLTGLRLGIEARKIDLATAGAIAFKAIGLTPLPVMEEAVIDKPDMLPEEDAPDAP